MVLKIQTKDFNIFDKFTKLNILGKIEFENTNYNRMKLNRIMNNLNSKEYNINVEILDNVILISKKKPFNLNVYLK